jgi:hypothetical protein
MKLRILLGGVLASGLVVIPFAPVHAKGPIGATVSGPGVETPIHVDFDEAPGQTVSHLAEVTGFYGATLGMSPDVNRLESAPAGDLGPRYDAVYRFGVDSLVRQQLYPFAQPVAVTYTRPGQRIFVGEETNGGWYRAPGLKPMLLAFGIPATPPEVPQPLPTSSSRSSFPVVPVIAGVGALALGTVVLVLLTFRARKWSLGQPVTRPVR